MAWTTIHPLPVDAGAPKTIRARADELAHRVGALREERRSFDEQRETYRAAAADAPFDTLHGGHFATVEAELLRSELNLRGDLATLAEEYHAALAGMRDAAIADSVKVSREITDALLAIGYHPFVESVIDPCKITPGFVAAHPRVVAAKLREQELFAKSNSRDWEAANNQAMDAIRARLLEIRSRHTAA